MDNSTLARNISALALEFPQYDYPSLRSRSFGFVKNLLRRNWFVDSKAVVSGEGGLNSLAFGAITSVIQHDDIDIGFNAYATFLTQTYGFNRQGNVEVSLDLLIENNIPTITEGRTPPSETFGSEAPSAQLGAELKLLSQKKPHPTVGQGRARKWTEQEVDFLDTYAHVGSLKEAAAMVGMDYQKARNFIFQLRRKAKRYGSIPPIVGDALTS